MNGTQNATQALTLNTLLEKQRENYDMACKMNARASSILVELTFNEDYSGKPGPISEKEPPILPLMGGIHELQKATNIQLDMLGEKLDNIGKILFGK